MRFDDSDYKVVVPQFMKEIVAEISRLARRSPDVNQRSGVSVRTSIATFEANPSKLGAASWNRCCPQRFHRSI